MDKKYEMTNKSTKHHGKLLYQIKALKDFRDIKAGDLGGFIEKEENLSHMGNCWIYNKAIVCGDAVIRNNAIICGDAIVQDNSIIQDDAIVQDSATIEENSEISGNTIVFSGSYMVNVKMYNNVNYNILNKFKPKTNSSLSIVYFNIKNHRLYFFNKETDIRLEDFILSKLCSILNKLSFVEYVNPYDISNEEKFLYNDYDNRYYKALDFKEGFARFWQNLSEDEKQIIKEMPNFNSDKFYEITGVNVE